MGIIADAFSADANTKVVSADNIPEGWMGLDNGPETTKEQKESLSTAKTVIMNGPMGVFEMDKFKAGTFDLINILADITKDNGCITIIGGGDSVAATELSGRADEMSHISTGGGASLELLEGKVLPGVAALNDASGAKTVGIGINGFGRIGRQVARIAMKDPETELK